MKLRLLLYFFLAFSFSRVLGAEGPSYIRTADGVIVFTDPSVTGTSHAVKLEVISDNIIRVIAAPGKEITSTQSLITVYSKRSDLSWNTIPSKYSLIAQNKKNSGYNRPENRRCYFQGP